ncbi:hypothetical protein [Streptomyces sp. CBMA152]|uniref:hypothetical protein n=1 Tax=Streptomyces sp. CBMA152 TaxID=1896312 RepID=UPI001660E327|nr:hypothetical protein [Streptomyces sp. CBMA152]MBD0743569.1 hypothetical protein [Streptomyces sp. CBMA152]
MTTATITADDLVRRYAEDIAYVAEQAPATDLDALVGQLDSAARNFDIAGINGHEDLETAGTLLGEAINADGIERGVFLRKADELLTPLWDMTSEYRDMVGD